MDLVAVAQETLSIVEQGAYAAPSGRRVELAPAIEGAMAGTRLYFPDELARLVAAGPPGPSRSCRIEVTTESTAEAGRRLLAEGGGHVAVLNFASARHVGGGFLGGARAQEEELCRASALFRCLERAPDYYRANRGQESALYTDHILWSPRVPFFRDESRALVEEPYPLSVITAPAPNTGAVVGREPDAESRIARTFTRRAAMVLAVAEQQGQDALVLGAWGCGAFQGDPEVAAGAFAQALEGRFAPSFARVVFAVLSRRQGDDRNVAAFRRRFA